MANQSINLKTINELRLDSQESPTPFFIAKYQRGFRWTPVQVTQLLEDIYEFANRRNPQPEDFYCLQPIVVKVGSDGVFEVVDGQQRLTTILLILRYFNSLLVEKRRLDLFQLAYATRPGLDGFLSDPNQGTANKNIDFFHVFAALQTIEQWFDERDNEVEKVKSAFLNQTKVIWFELADTENPVAAFTRLNVGKIPLTNDELIRALFLRRETEDPMSKNDLQMRISHEWDLIEKTLQDDAFWYFLNNERSISENRIGFLFRLVAEADGMDKADAADAYGVFYHFSRRLNSKEADPEYEWRRAKQEFMVLEEWFADRTLFHIVGLLVHNGTSLNELIRMSRSVTKKQFERRLRDKIYRDTIGPMPTTFARETVQEDVEDALEGVHYGRQSPKIRCILLLFNVATLLENDKSNMRQRFPASGNFRLNECE